MKRPNIILIMTDQQRFDTLGVYGNTVIQTPNLNSLAKDSVRYNSAYSTCPVCVPARGCCLTGLNEWNLGMLTYAPLKTEYPVTLPKLLKEEGYTCVAVGKNHFHPQRQTHGYDRVYLDESARIESKDFLSDYMEWFEKQTGHRQIIDKEMDFNGYTGKPYPYKEELHPTAWVKEIGLRELNKLEEAGRLFFLKLSFARPHSPYDPPKRWFDYYMGKELPAPYISQRDAKFEKVRWDNRTRWRGRAEKEEHQRARAGYFGNISFIDEMAGAFLQRLKDTGLYESSVIIFTSDHGDMLGDHNLWRKGYAYEGSTHIPMLIKPPADYESCFRKGMSVGQPVALYDLMKTVMGIVNKEKKFYTDGIDILNETRPIIDGTYIHGYARNMDVYFLTDATYKFIWYLRSGKLELYDIKKDKGELENLAFHPEFQGVLRRMIKEMENNMQQRGFHDLTSAGRPKAYRVRLPFNLYGKKQFSI